MTLHPQKHSLPSPDLLQPLPHRLLLVSVNLTPPGSLCEWSQTGYAVWWLAYSTEHHVLKVQPHCSMNSLLSVGWIVLIYLILKIPVGKFGNSWFLHCSFSFRINSILGSFWCLICFIAITPISFDVKNSLVWMSAQGCAAKEGSYILP